MQMEVQVRMSWGPRKGEFCSTRGREQSKGATGDMREQGSEDGGRQKQDVGGVQPPEEIQEELQSRCVLQPSGLSTCLFCSAGDGSLGLTRVGKGSAVELHVHP